MTRCNVVLSPNLKKEKVMIDENGNEVVVERNYGEAKQKLNRGEYKKEEK